MCGVSDKSASKKMFYNSILSYRFPAFCGTLKAVVMALGSLNERGNPVWEFPYCFLYNRGLTKGRNALGWLNARGKAICGIPVVVYTCN